MNGKRNDNGEGTPVFVPRKIRFLIALTLLAWATQTLMRQWARGDEIGGGSVQPERPVPASQRQALRQQLLQPPPSQANGSPNAPASPAAVGGEGTEKFVPGTERYLAGATLQLRAEATVVGGDVTLRQVCRWSGADRAAFDPIADLVLTRVPANAPYRSVSVEEIRQTLSDAGVNLGVVRLSGATACTVTRADASADQRGDMEAWVEARHGKNPAALSIASVVTAAPAPLVARSTPAVSPAGLPVVPSAGRPALNAGNANSKLLAVAFPAPNRATVLNTRNGSATNLSVAVNDPPAPDRDATVANAANAAQPADDSDGVRSLRQLIITDLAERLSLKPESLQLHFNPEDERILALAEPQFRFNLAPRRVWNLGDVSWDVTIVTEAGAQKTTIAATARAWQEQVLVNKPLSYHQVIREEDLADRRTLVDRVADDSMVTRQQVVGQMAGRDLKPGTILTGRLVEAVPLIRTGQLVTVTVDQGGVEVKTAARAMDIAAFGQTVRVRNEATRDIYEITCTGPQEGRMANGNAAAISANVANTPAASGKSNVASLDKD